MSRIAAEAGTALSPKKQYGVWLRPEIYAQICAIHKTRKGIRGGVTERISDVIGGLIGLGLDRIDRATGRVKASTHLTLFHETVDLNQYASDDDLRHAMDESPLMLWASDSQHQHLHANKKLVHYTGRSPASFRRGRWLDALEMKDRGAAAAICGEMMDKREPFNFIYRLKRKQGLSEVWIHDFAQPRLHPDGSFAGYVSTMVPTIGPGVNGFVIR